MESVKNWWYGSSKPAANKDATAPSPPTIKQQDDLQREAALQPVAVSQSGPTKEQQAAIQEEMRRAMDMVQETKTLYDDCEKRRMHVLASGKDPQDYSCEREFDAFKKAFDYQTKMEAIALPKQQ